MIAPSFSTCPSCGRQYLRGDCRSSGDVCPGCESISYDSERTFRLETSGDRCRRYRRRILEISQQVEAAHVAPAFSCIEIVDMLYHDIMRPQDIFLISKGHGCLAQYVVLEDRGELPAGDLDRYCRPDGALGAHPDRCPARGIHASTGSLGHGLGIAAGMALAEKRWGSGVRVYVLLSDGECQEGSTWEVAMVAANLRLDNLVAIVDYNDFNGMSRLSGEYPVFAPLADKFRAFGWWCATDTPIDGHDAMLTRNIQALLRLGMHAQRPRAIVCRTIKGRGVSFMETAFAAGDARWHYRSPSPDEYRRALAEIDGEGGE